MGLDDAVIDLRKDGVVPDAVPEVCIVGSGPAGAVLAVALAKRGVEVLLVEGGGPEPDYDVPSLMDKTDLSGENGLHFGFSRQIGGASNLWAGRIAPLEAGDFQNRSWVADGAWPFPYDEMSSYYAQAAQILGIPGAHYFSEPVPQLRAVSSYEKAFNRFLQGGAVDPKLFQWARTPFHAGDYLQSYLREKGESSSLRVLYHAPVVRLHEKEGGGGIEKIEIAGAAGRRAFIKARQFVLAAGGIETPRLLLDSSSADGPGIGNKHDVVGRYFSTHPKADMGMLVLDKRLKTDHPLFVDSALDGGRMRYGLGFDERQQEEGKLLNHYVQLSPFLEYKASRLFETIKGASVMNSGLIDRTPVMRSFLPALGLMVFEAISRLSGLQRRSKVFTLRAFLDQYPDPENRVMLSDDKDALGRRKVNMRWHFTGRDKDSVVRFFEALDSAVREEGLGRVEYKTLTAQDHWPLNAVHSHFMGTTRMGDDPRTSVTNENAQVHGVENLFIAGPSLFPSYGYANPVFTIAALSLRLADHLLDQPGA